MDRQKDGQTGPGNYNIDELKTLLALFVKKSIEMILYMVLMLKFLVIECIYVWIQSLDLTSS